MLASAASPGHRLREQWVQVKGGLASACGRLKSTYGGPRSAAELQSAKSGRRSGGRTGSGICPTAAALALRLLDGFCGPAELAPRKTLGRKQANFAGPARYEIATIPPTNRALTSQYCCGTGREP